MLTKPRYTVAGFSRILLTTVLFALPYILQAQVKDQANVAIEIVHTDMDDKNWHLSTQGTLILNKPQYYALMGGIDLTFIYDIEINEEHQYLWDRRVANLQIKRELSLHSLSNQFIVRDSYSKQLESFLTLELALGFITKLDNVALEKNKNYQDDFKYQGRLRLYLDIESLPIPMRLPAYINKEWSLSSNWLSWDVGSLN